MRNRLLLALCCVLFSCVDVRSEIENEVKRGAFPYMAILYYPDESVVDATGNRFQHAAVLIKPEWLLSTAIDHSVLDNVHLGFPRKTLLARMGALTLDANFTLNEDEDEQEREVIQIVKPSIHSKEVWWFTDITLLQTLLPFKLNSAIVPANINPKQVNEDKNCAILVYAKKFGNITEDKVLMQLSVELLPASIDNCGSHFTESTMTCAVPGEDMKNSLYDPEFCQGNSGGPLLCDGEVIALQTYIENNCKQPHLYQLLAPWKNFINCGIEQKCNVDFSCNICMAIPKDKPLIETVPYTPVLRTNIQNDTEASIKEPINLDDSVSWSQVPTVPENTMIENDTLEKSKSEGPQLNKSSKAEQSEISTSEQTESTPPQRQLDFLNYMNDDFSTTETTSTTNGTSSTTMRSPKEPWPKISKNVPTFEAHTSPDPTPKPKVIVYKQPSYRLASRLSSASFVNINAIQYMLPIIIFVYSI